MSIEQALARFEGPLLVYARTILRDGDRSRDVVQDTFLRLCQQSPRPADAALAGWLYTVCRHRALDVLRKETRMQPLDDATARARPTPEPGPSGIATTRDDAARALQVLAGLPRNQQEVVELKLRHHLSYAEIARITGHSVGNVGFLLHTGLKNLRARLGIDGNTAASAGGGVR